MNVTFDVYATTQAGLEDAAHDVLAKFATKVPLDDPRALKGGIGLNIEAEPCAETHQGGPALWVGHVKANL